MRYVVTLNVDVDDPQESHDVFDLIQEAVHSIKGTPMLAGKFAIEIAAVEGPQ